MKLAYIVSAYKLPEQLTRLVRRLSTADTTILVHVDRKTPASTFERLRGELAAENVMFLQRHRCYWGDFGHVEATLKGIRALRKHSIPFDYAILLTGQDYPIKSNAEIARVLESADGRSYLDHFDLPAPNLFAGGLNRIDRWHFHPYGIHLTFPPSRGVCARILGQHRAFWRRSRILPRRLPLNLRPYAGSSYWCLSRDCIDYVHDFVRRNPDVVRFFRRTLIPDETFFQTIIANSPLIDRVINANLRYISWDPRMPASPRVLNVSDLKEVLASDALFARKFDVTVDRVVLDELDEAIGAG